MQEVIDSYGDMEVVAVDQSETALADDKIVLSEIGITHHEGDQAILIR